jgi:t-SNARE complex subunit (syntaxin)
VRLRRDAGVRGARPNKLFTLTRRGAHSPATPPHPPPPSAGVSSQLAEVVKSAQAQANQGKKLLDAIKKEGEEEMRRDKKSARIQAYTAQYTRLCKVYVDAMKEHQRAKEALRKTQVDGVVRQGMSLPQNENKSEAEVRREVELAGPAAFLQSALMEEASDEAQAAYMDAESRAKDIDLLMRSINDVAALFQDLAVLVQEQSAQLDTIEVHVQAASKHIRKGNEALRDTIAYQKKNRKCFCCVICILVVVVLAITIGVGVFYGTKKA